MLLADRYCCHECGAEIELAPQAAHEGGGDFACCRSCGAELETPGSRPLSSGSDVLPYPGIAEASHWSIHLNRSGN